MNCTQVQTCFDRWLDGQLDAPTGEQLRAHLAGCPDCAAAWRAYEGAWGAFATAPQLEPASNFTARVMSGIERVEPEPVTRVGSLPRLVRWLAPATAVLALCVVMSGVWMRNGSDADQAVSQELVANLPVVQHLDLLSDLDIIANLDRLVPPPERDPIEEMMSALWNS
jgi:anti-sigma factor RsiW